MLKALVIDDNKLFVENLIDYMSSPPDEASILRFQRIDKAYTGAEAVRLAASGVHYDLIIYDLSMPWREGEDETLDNGIRLIKEVGATQPSACGILVSVFTDTREAATIEGLGAVRRMVPKYAGIEVVLLVAQEALLEATRATSQKLSVSYHLQAWIHQAMNSLNNVLAAASEIERICTPEAEFVPSRSLPLIREEVENIRRFQKAAESSLRAVDPEGTAKRELCDLVEIAQLCVNYLSSQHRKRHLDLQVEGPIPLTVGIREELQHMILLIATNALQATGEEGQVTIALRREPGDGREIVLVVEDEGAGIPEEVRPRIFDLGVTTREGGLGQGLFLARAFAWNHGGRIQAESPAGGGTRITVWLPVREARVDG